MRTSALPLLFLLCCCAKAEPRPAAQQSYCKEEQFEGSSFTVCDNRGGKLRLFAASKTEAPARSFAALLGKVEFERVAFAMNAGMFDEDGRPIGLAITQPGVEAHKVNLRDGPGNFHLKPNGIFMVRQGKPMVVESSALPDERTPAIQLATQSGPMLVIGGKLHTKLSHDGSSRLIRNGVGVRDGKALFVISGSAVSLGKFARFFRDGLKTPDALYFDGSVSSLWDPANGRQDSHSELGPIIVALKPVAKGPSRK